MISCPYCDYRAIKYLSSRQLMTSYNFQVYSCTFSCNGCGIEFEKDLDYFDLENYFKGYKKTQQEEDQLEDEKEERIEEAFEIQRQLEAEKALLLKQLREMENGF